MRLINLIGLCLLSVMSLAATHDPASLLTTIQGKPDEGAQIVQHYCALCHAPNPQISLGAPRMQVKQDWAVRMQAGLTQLLEHTTQGYQAMPARGGCLECTDAQLALAIQHMLPK
jgi:cytochrome c5